MKPRERIATILFIEQLKHTKANVCQGVTYKEIVLREEKTHSLRAADIKILLQKGK